MMFIIYTVHKNKSLRIHKIFEYVVIKRKNYNEFDCKKCSVNI